MGPANLWPAPAAPVGSTLLPVTDTQAPLAESPRWAGDGASGMGEGAGLKQRGSLPCDCVTPGLDSSKDQRQSERHDGPTPGRELRLALMGTVNSHGAGLGPQGKTAALSVGCGV